MDKLVADFECFYQCTCLEKKTTKTTPHHPPILATTDDILKKKHRVIDAGHIN